MKSKWYNVFLALFVFLSTFLLSLGVIHGGIVVYKDIKYLFIPPKFSVIVSCYNYETFLPQTLDSILSQTEDNLEIIVVDDGSTDGSREVIKAYAKKDKRVRPIYQKNAGLSISRNRAMKIARGKYIWFVDADDWIDKEALSRLWEKAEALNLDLCSFKQKSIDEEGNLLPDSFYLTSFPSEIADNSERALVIFELPFEALNYFPVTSGKQIYKREFLEKNDITFPERTVFEDDVFFVHTLYSGARFSAIFDYLYMKRTHWRQITAGKEKYWDSTLRISRMIYERVLNASKDELEARRVFGIYFNGAIKKWEWINPFWKKKFYPELSIMSEWLQKRPQDKFWDKQRSKWHSFVEKQKEYAS